MTTLEQVLQASHSQDPATRKQAVHDLCPCELKADHPEAWSRILELTRDDDVGVRKVAYHTLIDGSPKGREADVVRALESMHNDPDLKLRRQVRKVLARFRSTGRVTSIDAVSPRQKAQFCGSGSTAASPGAKSAVSSAAMRPPAMVPRKIRWP